MKINRFSDLRTSDASETCYNENITKITDMNKSYQDSVWRRLVSQW